MPPDTCGNLLFKLHLFLSKLCQTRNLFYYIYTYVFRSPLSTYPSYRLHFAFQPQTSFTHPLLHIRLTPLFLPFDAKHGHTQNPLIPSVIAIYILCRFVFNTMKPPSGLIGQKETTKGFPLLQLQRLARQVNLSREYIACTRINFTLTTEMLHHTLIFNLYSS